MYRLLCVFLVLYGVKAGAQSCDLIPNTADFIAGHYELIARFPDSMKTYTASVRIEASKNGTISMIELSDKSSKHIWQGHFRAASPGDGCVLELVSAPYKMSCLVSVDLDNNARLTCHWGWKDKVTKHPGIAALFPM